jgi:hypothetical protein
MQIGLEILRSSIRKRALYVPIQSGLLGTVLLICTAHTVWALCNSGQDTLTRSPAPRHLPNST